MIDVSNTIAPSMCSHEHWSPTVMAWSRMYLVDDLDLIPDANESICRASSRLVINTSFLLGLYTVASWNLRIPLG